jgi:hypothetical protein
MTELFIHFKNPSQLIYAGDDYLDLYKVSKGTAQKIGTLADVSIFEMGAAELEEVKGELAETQVGIVLNSGSFIFNIFEFEKIPLWEERQRELIEWRVQKVFPENMELYLHHYFRLSRNRFLSILLKKDLLHKIEQIFRENQLELIYIGNSTVEIMNHLWKTSRKFGRKRSADFLIEIDQDLSTIVFQDKFVPYYLRKFRSDQDSDMVEEIVKTLNFVKTSYARDTLSYSLLAVHPKFDLQAIRDGLAEQEINEIKGSIDRPLYLPGIR